MDISYLERLILQITLFLGGKVTYTVEDAIDKLGYGPFQIKLMFVIGLAWVSDRNSFTEIPDPQNQI